ncbi:MAG: NAD(P)-dependent alcohol dehydrogenase [Betaproteobacteria bacterium]|nr:NAD(P)-dependent alcohol dehydrogenase [Betaproteobacteria bacterium]
MKAIVHERYGPPEVLLAKEWPKPQPKPNEVLIRIHATTVASADRRVRSLDVPLGFGLFSRLFFGITRPRRAILGAELAGVVEAIGRDVTRFAVGDPVFGIDGVRMGGYAQFKCMPQDGALARKPANLSFEEAAALAFGGTTALDFFRRGKLRQGESVLINGASGGVGCAAVQLASDLGAKVTGVCSAANADLVRSLGASHVIDYTRTDFTRNGKTYDVIVDAVGTALYSRSKASLTPDGRLLLVAATLPQMLHIPWVAMTSRHRIVAGPAAERSEDLALLAKLAEVGRFTPVIDRRYAFDEMADAHRYVDSGHKRGNVVVTVSHDDK